MLQDVLFIIIGLTLLTFGGDGLVKGAVAAAARAKVSPLLIGLTIVAFGTSMPEMVVSIKAAFNGKPDIALGNVVGSNIANVLLILSVTALVYPIALPQKDSTIKKDCMVMISGCLFLWAACLYGLITWYIGLFFIICLAAYLYWAYRNNIVHEEVDTEEAAHMALYKIFFFISIGLLALVGGGHLLVDGSSNLASSIGISERVIGLTIVAIGTSLPELAASVAAALKKHSDIALGNVIGSNIFNVFCIIGVTSLLHPISVNPSIAGIDSIVMILASLALLLMLYKAASVNRLFGALLFTCYASYVFYLLLPMHT